MSDSVWPHRQKPTRLLRPGDSPGKNTGVGCHFLLQCMKVKSESEVAQSHPTLCDPRDCSLPGSSVHVHGIFQAKVLEWVAIAFSHPQAKDAQATRSKERCTEQVFLLSCQKEPTLTRGFQTPHMWDSELCLSHSVYGTLLWKPKGTHTYGKVKTVAFPQGKGSHWRVFLWEFTQPFSSLEDSFTVIGVHMDQSRKH